MVEENSEISRVQCNVENFWVAEVWVCAGRDKKGAFPFQWERDSFDPMQRFVPSEPLSPWYCCHQEGWVRRTTFSTSKPRFVSELQAIDVATFVNLMIVICDTGLKNILENVESKSSTELWPSLSQQNSGRQEAVEVFQRACSSPQTKQEWKKKAYPTFN